MQRIISWNVASVRARLPVLMDLIAREEPDIVMLQETKSAETRFPTMDFLAKGYYTILSGQKMYNGVAILSRIPVQNPVYALSGFEDQARFVQCETPGGIVLICVYVPNGTPPPTLAGDTTRLHYKLRWLQALRDHVHGLMEQGRSVILAGDFNVIERDDDVYDPDVFRDTALMTDSVRQAWRDLLKLPLDNAVRRFNPEPHTYSFWDFQGGAWPRNNGILLDAVLTTPSLIPAVQNALIYRDVRGWNGTSDHAPIGLILGQDIL